MLSLKELSQFNYIEKINSGYTDLFYIDLKSLDAYNSLLTEKALISYLKENWIKHYKTIYRRAPEKEPNAYKWISGELLTYYHDWEIIKFGEVIFKCNSSGIHHKHAMNRIIAKKYEYGG